MADKLYSRWRIKLPNLREYKSIKSLLLIAFFSILIAIGMFLKSAYPVLKSSCETAAGSKGNKIINIIDKVNSILFEILTSLYTLTLSLLLIFL